MIKLKNGVETVYSFGKWNRFCLLEKHVQKPSKLTESTNNKMINLINVCMWPILSLADHKRVRDDVKKCIRSKRISIVMNFEHNFILFNDYLRIKASDRVIMRLTAANDIKTPSQAIGNVA